MIKAIFFDFDGTLADTAPGIINTMTVTFQKMGVTVPSVEAMRQTIGIPLTQALQIAGHLSDEDALRAKDLYCELFMVYEIEKIGMFPRVFETLVSLSNKGYRMAIVTSRNKESLDLILKRYGLTGYFEQIITNNDHLTPKPAPDMVLELLWRMKVSAGETLVVGDTTFDIDMGNNAHCRTCAVIYGNHTRQQLLTSNPDYVIDTFEELKTILSK